MGTGILQVGKENDWRAVAVNQSRMVALKSDGSLWQWHFVNPWNMSQEQLILTAQEPPTRLGIHNDWVALANTWEDVIALAADGSLWLWPDHEPYERYTFAETSQAAGISRQRFLATRNETRPVGVEVTRH